MVKSPLFTVFHEEKKHNFPACLACQEYSFPQVLPKEKAFFGALEDLMSDFPHEIGYDRIKLGMVPQFVCK